MKRRLTYFLVLGFSLLLNIWHLIIFFNTPEYKFGVLKTDVSIVLSDSQGKNTSLNLPKGITVKNETPRGFSEISLIAPHRFSVHIADSQNDLVDYSQPGKRYVYFTKRTESGNSE